METSSRFARSRQVALAALAAFVVAAAGSVTWGALLITNLRTTPAVPWSAPAMVVILWLLWQYLGGRWWPSRTSAVRRRLLRRRLVPAPIAGDLLFFTLIWPADATRSLVWTHGADGWFWLDVVQVLVFAALAVGAFRRLARLRSRDASQAGNRLSPPDWA